MKKISQAHTIDSQNTKEFQYSLSINSSKSDSTIPSFQECLSSVEQLSGPVYQLNEIIQDLIDYKNDAEFAALNAPKLAEQLQPNTSLNDTLAVVSQIHKLARFQAARCGLVNCSQLVRAVIHILKTTKNADLRSEAALTLQLLTKALSGAKLACEEIGISELVEMLRHPSEVMYTTALYVLNQLLWHLPNSARPEFRQYNGHLNLIYLLETNSLKDSNWLLICLDTLRMAVYESSETKLSLTSTSIYEIIVRLLRIYPNNAKIAYNIARLIKVLSVCNENKIKLVEAGAVEIRINDTLSTIASLFVKYQFVSALPLLKSVVGLVRNLSTDEMTRHELKNLNVHRMIANIFSQAYTSLNEVGKQDSGISERISSNGYMEGVNLEDMLELTLAALHIMAKDSGVQEELIHTAGLVSTVVRFILHQYVYSVLQLLSLANCQLHVLDVKQLKMKVLALNSLNLFNRIMNILLHIPLPSCIVSLKTSLKRIDVDCRWNYVNHFLTVDF
ncbi:unnamed protein product [Trichobilharzia szidati]|nr:unnamed protein product [Trichobilharzia szidati]